jgi:hypothetical protein
MFSVKSAPTNKKDSSWATGRYSRRPVTITTVHKVTLGPVFLPERRLPCQYIPPMLQSRVHINITLIKRQAGEDSAPTHLGASGYTHQYCTLQYAGT